MLPLAITSSTILTGIGAGKDETAAALRAGASGLKPISFDTVALSTYVGAVPGIDDEALTGDMAAFDCRNNRLAAKALKLDRFDADVARAREKYGPARIGVFLGTSTSGILTTELAYRTRNDDGTLIGDFPYEQTHSTFSLAKFVAHYLGLSGPAEVISAACASTNKAFGNAARMIAAGICDAAIVGGADSLCLTTLYGFNSLMLVSPQPCRPFDAARDGISIGEGAGFVLLEKAGANDDIHFLGIGESSDAHHMSSPHPDGLGARMAMERALASANLTPSDMDYVNLHGTATPVGDAAEDRAITGLFGRDMPCSSVKGFTGHTLGASGVVEAIISLIALQHGFMPGTAGARSIDPTMQANLLLQTTDAKLNRVMSNSFGFGGSNCSVILGAGGVMRVYLEGIGLCGPGFTSWNDSREVLSGAAPYTPLATIIPMPDVLPANERRRTVPTVKLALAVGIEAFTNAGRDAKDTATVFTSSGGDGETMHSILEVLATDAREVSPTRFHNSVHNAPSGYWSIAVGSHEPTTSICAYDASFAAGLMDAAAQAMLDRRAVAVIAYDLPYPSPTLAGVRPIIDVFGVALVLTPEPTAHTLATLDLEIAPTPATIMQDGNLEKLRLGNPAARSLPLLQAIAAKTSQRVVIEYLNGTSLDVRVTC